VFVEQGGMLVIRGNTTASSNAVTAGSGGGTGAGDGQALGTGFFLHNVDLMFDITGMTTISDNLTDNSLLNGGDGTVSQLFKSGPGTLVLGAANQYHGGTSINGGTIRLEDNLGLGTGTLTVLGSTLDLANGITSANNIDLQNDLTISQADSGGLGTLTGIISETGGPFGLTKTGVGTIVLQGQNTFTGLVSVQAGRLTLNSGDERFASGVGIDVTAGAVFEIDSITETVSSLTGLGSIEITNAGTFRVNNSSASVFGGVISGTGTLTKLGAGTVNLTGTSLLPGNTSVDAGTLRVNGSLPGAVAVNSGGTLGGAGMVGNTTINSGGRIAPGNSIGTMTVNGNFTQEAGSEFEVELNPASNPTTPGTDNDFIDVNGGSATLNGGNVNVIASGNPDLGTLYTILDADGGVTGTYASLTDNVVSRDFNLIYNPGNVQLSVSRTALNLGALGQTFNERAVGSALDVIFPTAGGEAGAALDQFFLLTPNQQQATLNELGGDIFGSLGVASLQTTSFILGQLGDSLNATPFSSPPPLVITTPGGFGAGDASIRLVSASTGCASVLDNANATDIDTLMIHAPQRRAQSPSACDWNGFVTGYGMGGFLQSDGNAAGLDYGLGGVMVGVFREVERGQRMGLFGAFGRSDASTGSPRQSAETDHYLGGLFLQSVDGCDKWTQDGVCGPIRPTLSALWMHEYADESTSVTSSFGGTPSFTTRGLDLGSDWAVLGAGLSWQATRRLTLSLNYTTQANDQTSLHYGGGTAVWAW
jgi:autotransporter-associated beta strand protein